MVLIPFGFYLLWATLYYLFMFVIKEKKIREQQYRTLYVKFSEYEWSGSLMRKVGPTWSPFFFMCFHAAFFTIGHLLAIASYYSFAVHTVSMCVWLASMNWNGACYYVKNIPYTAPLDTTKSSSESSDQ